MKYALYLQKRIVSTANGNGENAPALQDLRILPLNALTHNL